MYSAVLLTITAMLFSILMLIYMYSSICSVLLYFNNANFLFTFTTHLCVMNSDLKCMALDNIHTGVKVWHRIKLHLRQPVRSQLLLHTELSSSYIYLLSYKSPL